MFISRTTREERVTIETALDSAFLKIDQAEQLIYDLIDAFLSDREQKTLDKHDAQTIRNNLMIADDLLADAAAGISPARGTRCLPAYSYH